MRLAEMVFEVAFWVLVALVKRDSIAGASKVFEEPRKAPPPTKSMAIEMMAARPFFFPFMVKRFWVGAKEERPLPV